MHVVRYLTSHWIRRVVHEFQSPHFRSETMLQFEILLLAGVALMPALFRRRRLAELLMILFWAQVALVSARNVPLYTIVAAPVCAEEARLWSRSAAGFNRRSIVGTLRDCLSDFSASPQRLSVWLPVLLLCMAAIRWDWPRASVQQVSRGSPYPEPRGIRILR
jgi:hypothetical protein